MLTDLTYEHEQEAEAAPSPALSRAWRQAQRMRQWLLALKTTALHGEEEDVLIQVGHVIVCMYLCFLLLNLTKSTPSKNP